MLINQQPYRTIWHDAAERYVEIIDQTRLPFEFVTHRITSFDMMLVAIKSMQVRGAPLIGVAGAYAIALAMKEAPSDSHLSQSAALTIACRPTAVNLAWAVQRMQNKLMPLAATERPSMAWREAAAMAEEDVHQNRAIGQHGLKLLQDQLFEVKARTAANPLNVLTHCNAGWLATVDYGTALAPIYAAHDADMPIHVWVDETRPRNQGASLTAWELARHGVPHTVISDNTGGHLMQQGLVDMVIVGADRVTRDGDVCNKIGTYLKALAAYDNHVPFYVAVPSPTIDWQIRADAIEIEHRQPEELSCVSGLTPEGGLSHIRLMPAETPILNPAFDVTPARLVSGFITEHGVVQTAGLAALEFSIRNID
jgi:methylthioribose-1-phosphate isomerase